MSNTGIYVMLDGHPLVDELFGIFNNRFKDQVAEFIKRTELFALYPDAIDEITSGMLRLFFANSILPKIPEEAFDSDLVDNIGSLTNALDSWANSFPGDEVTRIIVEGFIVYGLRGIDILGEMLYNERAVEEANEAFDLAEQIERQSDNDNNILGE